MKVVVLIILFILMVFLIILAFKNENTFNNHCMILNAIYMYRTDCIRKWIELSVDYDDKENYIKTVFRFWDWGYTRILPKDKFEIIKPYIKK